MPGSPTETLGLAQCGWTYTPWSLGGIRSGLALLLLAAVGCGGASTPPVRDSKALVRPSLRTARVPDAERPARFVPPLSQAQRFERARTALPPGLGEPAFLDLGPASPLVLALAPLPSRGNGEEVLLGLVDVRKSPGVLLGRHDFADGQAELRGAMTLQSAAREEVVLAELLISGKTVACGWWLHPRRSRFLCAPKLEGVSRYESHEGLLREVWQTEFPPRQDLEPRLNGRVFGFSARGNWVEVDGFRCLGMTVPEALAAADSRSLRRWQKDSIQRHLRTAMHLSQTLQDERSVQILREALSIDGCDPVVWRRLGRLAFQSGRVAESAPSLAIAAALNSREPATWLDLADTLVELETDTPAGRDSWQRVEEILQVNDRLLSVHQGTKTPREFAQRLYEEYLAMTEADELLHASARRRAQERLRELSLRRGTGSLR